MLSVIHVTNNYTPYQGGVTRSVCYWHSLLRQKGYQSTIITIDFGTHGKNEDHVIRIPSVFKTTYHNNAIALPIATRIHLKRIFSDIKPDIVHVHHPFLLGYTAASIAYKQKLPCIFTYHTQYDKYLHYIPFSPHVAYQILRTRMKNFFRLVTTTIAPSSSIKHMLTQDYTIYNTVVIPTPAESLFFTQTPKHLPENTPITILTVSRFAQEKNIHFLLNVMKRLEHHHNFNFILAGYGPQTDALMHYAYEILHLDRTRVRFIINPDRPALVKLYRAADIFIFSSKTDTQALVLAEAMASGLPLVALDAPGSRDSICHKINGLLVHNEQEMCQALIKLIDDPACYAAYSRGSILRSQEFHESTLFNRLVSIYYSSVQHCATNK